MSSSFWPHGWQHARLLCPPRVCSDSSPLSWTPSNQLILCHPLLLLPSIFHSIRVFSSGSALSIRWPKYWRFPSKRLLISWLQSLSTVILEAMKIKSASYIYSYHSSRWPFSSRGQDKESNFMRDLGSSYQMLASGHKTHLFGNLQGPVAESSFCTPTPN